MNATAADMKITTCAGSPLDPVGFLETGNQKDEEDDRNQKIREGAAEVTIHIVPQEEGSPFYIRIEPNKSISDLYKLISTTCNRTPSSFFLTQDKFNIISETSSSTVRDFVQGSDPISFHLIASWSVVLIIVTSPEEIPVLVCAPPTTTLSSLHSKLSPNKLQHIEINHGSIVPHNSTIPLSHFLSESSNHINIELLDPELTVDVSVQLRDSTYPSLQRQNSSLSLLYSELATFLNIPLTSFYLYKEEFIILPSTTEIPEVDKLSLKFVASTDVVLVQVHGNNTSHLLGFPPTYPSSHMWNFINQLVPNTVGFITGEYCRKCPAEDEDADVELETVSNLAEFSPLEILTESSSEVLRVVVMFENSYKEFYAHSNLQVGELYAVILGEEADLTKFYFIGPNNIDLDPETDVWNYSVIDYINSRTLDEDDPIVFEIRHAINILVGDESYNIPYQENHLTNEYVMKHLAKCVPDVEYEPHSVCATSGIVSKNIS